MSRKRQTNAAERLMDTANNSSSSSSSSASRKDSATSELGRRRGTNASHRKPLEPSAAANSTSEQIAEVIMIEEGAPQNAGTDPSAPKRTRRRESKTPLQGARPDRQAGDSRGSVGRSERASGSTNTRPERGSKTAAGKGKDVAASSTAVPAAPNQDAKLARSRQKPKPGPTNLLQPDPRTIPSRSKTRTSSDAKQRTTPRQAEKQAAQTVPESSRPAPGRMSKTLQREIEAQKSQKTQRAQKPELKTSGPSTGASTPERAKKAHMSETQRRESLARSEIAVDKPKQKLPGSDKSKQTVKATNKTKKELSATDKIKQKQPETDKMMQKSIEADITKYSWIEVNEEPVEESKIKPTTKICIRWLPADLPEHVFWRSVEPALPWFDPEKVGSVKQKECEVLCALIKDSDKENGPASAEVAAIGETPAAEKERNIELRRSSLAETNLATVDVYESENLARLDSQPYWRQYSPGKKHRSKAKPDDPSRAYILFAEPAEADHFYQRFHGHAFGKNGVVSRAIVELALAQHVPWSLPAPVPTNDPLEGTIDTDPHFAAFFKTAIKDSTQDDGQPGGSASLSDAETQQSHISYAAATASLGKDGGTNGTQGFNSESRKETKATPLIEHLRKVKGIPVKPSAAAAAKSTEPAPSASSKSPASRSAKKKVATAAAAAAAAAANGAAPPTPTSKRSRRRKQ
ncbi:hypothetical protein EV179_003024 [Coemansia sp. RSA 487]|nr:hypothetical protein EV179_003024 [Coemansia sp. RSA 487]